MLTYKEKLAVISQMIQLSKVDGVFHEKERQFIDLMASEYHIKDTDLQEILKESQKDIVFHSNFQRIEHFYRMALLMHSDKSRTEEELVYIKNMGLKLGLSPFAVQSVMDEMQKSEKNMIDGEKLLEIFKRDEN
jgi:uncharacterized tellurite resistance protein B-like protein